MPKAKVPDTRVTTATSTSPLPRSDHEADAKPDRKDPKLHRSAFYWVKENRVEQQHTITAFAVARNYGVPNKHLVSYLKKEISEGEACRGIPFTLLLAVSYAAMAIGHDDAITIRAVEDSLEYDIKATATFAFTGPYMGHKNIEDVRSHSEFYTWMREGLVPLIFKQRPPFHEGYNEEHTRYKEMRMDPSPEERGFWLTYNRIVGGMRLVQERSEATACTTLEELLPLYNMDCVGGLDYNLDPEIGLPNERAQTTINPVREKWLYIFDDIEVVQEQVRSLEEGQWLDKHTKKIEIGIPIYNAEFGVHTLVRVNFYFTRGGHVWKNVLPQSQFADWHAALPNGIYDGIWVLCLLYIFFAECYEIQSIVRAKGGRAVFTNYMTFFNFIDMLTVLGGVAIICTFLKTIGNRNWLNKNLEALAQIDYLTQRSQYEEQVASYFAALLGNVSYLRHFRRALTLYLVIIMFRLFKAFSAQPRLALVTRTMVQAGPDLFHFFIVFASMFFTFVICGVVLFGRKVPTFTTLARAVCTSLNVVLGSLRWDELSVVGRFPAGVWLWLFIIAVGLLMLNIVLAILMDTYAEVKEQAGKCETIWEEAWQVVKRWIGAWRGTYVPLEKVLQSLQRRLGSDTEEKDEARTHTRGSSSPAMSSRGVVSFADEFGSVGLKGEASPSSDMEASATCGVENEAVITVDQLREAVAQLAFLKMSEAQALEVIQGAVHEYYKNNKGRYEMDEVLQLTQDVSLRVKKLTRLTRRSHEVRDSGPVKELQSFAEDLDAYIKDVRAEREAKRQELEKWKSWNAALEDRLQQISPLIDCPSDAGDSNVDVMEVERDGLHGPPTVEVADVDVEVDIDARPPIKPPASREFVRSGVHNSK